MYIYCIYIQKVFIESYRYITYIYIHIHMTYVMDTMYIQTEYMHYIICPWSHFLNWDRRSESAKGEEGPVEIQGYPSSMLVVEMMFGVCSQNMGVMMDYGHTATFTVFGVLKHHLYHWSWCSVWAFVWPRMSFSHWSFFFAGSNPIEQSIGQWW